MKTRLRWLAVACCCAATVARLQAQIPGSPAKVRVTPGIEYRAGALHRVLAGDHWRDLWATEFEVEVLDLETFAGGLTPVKKGGSLQTLNLRLLGNDGREYKFRSLNKDGRRTLPPELQGTFVGDVFQDQISIGNPMAAVVVSPLLDALDILNAKPRLVLMPASERLGEFKQEFAGVLGTIEEHPKAGKNDPGFRGADKIVDGFEPFEELREDNDERVDAAKYLTVRLVDLLIGDRDRHADQYRWARYKRDGKRVWLPIPRDRDFAFGRYDGLFPWASGLFVHSAVGFGESYPSILELTWIGRHLDRRLLSELDKPTWDSVTAHIQTTLTDSLLLEALHRMPREMFSQSGEKMFAMLKSRRDKLHDAADEFYRLVSDVVDVYGSDKPERLEVNKRDNATVEVRLFKKKSGELLFSRTFSNDLTNEIRIHLLGGDDVVTVEGSGRPGILVRILGRDGDNELTDASEESKTIFYKDASNEEVLEPALEDRYRIWRTLPLLSFNSDDGMIFGGTSRMTQHAFRAAPHAYSLALKANYAPAFGRYDGEFRADSYTLVAGARAEVLVTAGNRTRSNFYGIGNESPFSDSLNDDDFYETRYHAVRIEPSLAVQMSNPLMFRIGAMYEYAGMRVQASSFLDRVAPYGVNTRSTMAVTAGLTFETRNIPLAPTKGVYVHTAGVFYPAILSNDFSFGKAAADVRVYVPATLLTNSVFALHAGAERTFGTYPFYKASSTGGASTIRGFARDRFAGDASLYGQAELRAELGHVSLLMPGQLGFSFFGDVGRVFVEGEKSRRWHSGFGGGLWFNVMNMFVLNVSAAGSTEGTRLYVTSGFAF